VVEVACEHGVAQERKLKKDTTVPMGWVLEIDIRAYFDSIVRPHLVEMIERRVNDGSVLRLIRKWIKVGAIDNGKLFVSETGTRLTNPLREICTAGSVRRAISARSRKGKFTVHVKTRTATTCGPNKPAPLP